MHMMTRISCIIGNPSKPIAQEKTKTIYRKDNCHIPCTVGSEPLHAYIGRTMQSGRTRAGMCADGSAEWICGIVYMCRGLTTLTGKIPEWRR